MSTTFVENLSLTTETCCKCHVTFAMPTSWRDHYLKTRDSFYCPAGHSQHYTAETEEERLKRQVAQLQTRVERQEAYEVTLRQSNQHLRNSRATVRGHLTRVCNRVKNGVCPCCNRTFSNLASHMHTKHPTYQEPQT